jgi:hypothetical protein
VPCEHNINPSSRELDLFYMCDEGSIETLKNHLFIKLNNSINMVLNIVVIFEANILCRKVEKDYV